MSDTMITSLPEVPYATPQLSSSKEQYATPQLSSSKEQLVRASAHLWRVQDATGRVLGHLRLLPDPLGMRYRAERLHLATASFRLVGDFWKPDDAVAALRNG